MYELMSEIWSSVRKNKLRTFLTGFSVAWGILMLIILLGCGNGLKRGLTANFDYMNTNSMELYSSWTSMPYAGYDAGRFIRLNNDDIRILQTEFPNVDEITFQETYSINSAMSCSDRFFTVNMAGVMPDHKRIYKTEILEGRFINTTDIEKRRKVCVISRDVRDILFGDEEAVGRQVTHSGIVWTVAGVYKENEYGSNSTAFVPYSTGQLIYAGNNPWIDFITFTLKDVKSQEQMDALESQILRRLSYEHNYDPKDRNAIFLYNNFTAYKNINRVFTGIDIFLWLIGCSTLLAGVVGVGNIMLVTVRERTFEFGIRKALGARPSSIIRMILLESVAITALAGYTGLVLGVAVMEAANNLLERNSSASGMLSIFRDPTIDISAAIYATLLLIAAGLVAGYIPARRAAHIKTIDALRHNR